MALAYYLPKWFFNYDIFLELAFSIILFLVAFLAFKIYRVTKHKQIRLLGMSFLLIALSNLIESMLNILIVSYPDFLSGVISLASLAWLNTYSYVVFTTLGMSFLLYMSFKTENYKILWILIATSLLFIYSSKDPIYSFYLLTMIYLIFISAYFIEIYIKNKRFDTLLLVLAFSLLLIDKVLFVFSFNRELSYVLGHFPQLVAYLLILWNFYLVKKSGHAKKMFNNLKKVNLGVLL